MTQEQAAKIAELLNTRNQLQGEYTADKVLQHPDKYLIDIQDGVVIACVEIKKVQWYQWELLHLSVKEGQEGKGLGKRLIRQAEEKAKQGGARIIQCTIRVGNEASEQAFRRSGYREACCFYNAKTDRYIAVWQKVLSYRAEQVATAGQPRE